MSQSHISGVAKRGVAYIKADNPDIGLMAVVMIGMAEVSSVDFFDKPNGLKKGDKIGRFHFGGSTHCLIFGPNVKLSFNLEVIPNPGVQNPGSPIHVLGRLATVNPSNCKVAAARIMLSCQAKAGLLLKQSSLHLKRDLCSHSKASLLYPDLMQRKLHFH